AGEDRRVELVRVEVALGEDGARVGAGQHPVDDRPQLGHGLRAAGDGLGVGVEGIGGGRRARRRRGTRDRRDVGGARAGSGRRGEGGQGCQDQEAAHGPGGYGSRGRAERQLHSESAYVSTALMADSNWPSTNGARSAGSWRSPPTRSAATTPSSIASTTIGHI